MIGGRSGLTAGTLSSRATARPSSGYTPGMLLRRPILTPLALAILSLGLPRLAGRRPRTPQRTTGLRWADLPPRRRPADPARSADPRSRLSGRGPCLRGCAPSRPGADRGPGAARPRPAAPAAGPAPHRARPAGPADRQPRPRRRGLLARGDGPSRLDCTAHFCVHWIDHAGFDNAPDLTDLAPANGLPDYVDAVGAAAEQVYAVENGSLGWQAPKPDGTRGGGRRRTSTWPTSATRTCSATRAPTPGQIARAGASPTW